MAPYHSGSSDNCLEAIHEFWCQCWYNPCINDTWCQQRLQWHHCIPDIETIVFWYRITLCTLLSSSCKLLTLWLNFNEWIDYFDLMNAIVSLTTARIMWHQCKRCLMTRRVMFHLFQSSQYIKCSGAIDIAINIMSCQCWHQWTYMIQKSCCTLLWSSWPLKYCGATHDAMNIMWCWC